MNHLIHLLYPFTPIVLGVSLVASSYIVTYLWRKRSGLNRIPTVGPSGILTSWLGSFVTLVHGHRLIQEGYERYHIFKIPRFFSWLVLVHGPEYLDDIRRADNDQLSFLAAVNEAVQFDYTVGPGLLTNTYHLNIVRGPMTRNIGVRFPDLLDEMDKALGDLLTTDTHTDWISLPAYSSVVHIISRVSARFFAGPQLSSNPRYTDIMQGFTGHVAVTGFVLRQLPTFLKPIVSRALFNSPAKVTEVEEYLRPIIEARLEKSDDDPEPNDMITWLLISAPEGQRTTRDITIRMIFLNVVAIHTTSTLLTHVLFNLAIYTSYIKPLRDEISSVIGREGWTKIAIEKMRKLDSFVKESQRFHGCDAVVMARKVVKDFTFSDGTFIPKGSNLAVTSRAINHDAHYYPNPQEFQGFRFAEQDPAKHQMTALTSEFMTFGLGRHACPGRFFAITEIKTIVARLLLEYDIKLTDEQNGRPKDTWFTGVFIAPNRTARVSFRKRGL